MKCQKRKGVLDIYSRTNKKGADIMSTSKKIAKNGTKTVVKYGAKKVASRYLGKAAISVAGISLGAPIIASVAAGFIVEAAFDFLFDD